MDLLKSLPTAGRSRQRATVYMHGLAEMRREWKTGKGETPFYLSAFTMSFRATSLNASGTLRSTASIFTSRSLRRLISCIEMPGASWGF